MANTTQYPWIMEMLEGAERIAAYTGKQVEIEYDGRGHITKVNGKSTASGPTKKGTRGPSTAKDKTRAAMLEGINVVVSRVKAFEKKTRTHRTEGLVISLADADYTIKVQGHTKCEYTIEEGFKAEKNFLTRGQGPNHSSLIAKLLVSEIENENLKTLLGFENEIHVVNAKASGVRIQTGGQEYTIKISKKRARVGYDDCM